jgi:hypothetical protein
MEIIISEITVYGPRPVTVVAGGLDGKTGLLTGLLAEKHILFLALDLLLQ